MITDFDGVHTDDRALGRPAWDRVRPGRAGDGMGVALLRQAGVPFLIVSTERNPVVGARAAKLGVDVLQGVDDKVCALTAGWTGGGSTRSGRVRGQRRQRPAGDGGGRLAGRRGRRPARGAPGRPAGAQPSRRPGRRPRGLRPGPRPRGRSPTARPARWTSPHARIRREPGCTGRQHQPSGLARAPPRRSATSPAGGSRPLSRRRTRSVILLDQSASPRRGSSCRSARPDRGVNRPARRSSRSPRQSESSKTTLIRDLDPEVGQHQHRHTGGHRLQHGGRGHRDQARARQRGPHRPGHEPYAARGDATPALRPPTGRRTGTPRGGSAPPRPRPELDHGGARRADLGQRQQDASPVGPLRRHLGLGGEHHVAPRPELRGRRAGPARKGRRASPTARSERRAGASSANPDARAGCARPAGHSRGGTPPPGPWPGG